MGFNATDAHNLNLARENHFATIGIKVEDEQCCVIRIEVGRIVTIEQPASLLANAMMSAMRAYNHGDSTTVWLDIQTVEIPTFVLEAIERCRGFGLGLVVTHGEACSHPPGLPLPKRLIDAMERAQGGGWVWHPIAKKRVSAFLD